MDEKVRQFFESVLNSEFEVKVVGEKPAAKAKTDKNQGKPKKLEVKGEAETKAESVAPKKEVSEEAEAKHKKLKVLEVDS